MSLYSRDATRSGQRQRPVGVQRADNAPARILGQSLDKTTTTTYPEDSPEGTLLKALVSSHRFSGRGLRGADILSNGLDLSNVGLYPI